jgi:hypothetical protein
MGRNLERRQKFTITTEKDFDNLKKYGILNPDSDDRKFPARVQQGKWMGTGEYILLRYEQKCPRGCCYDDVNEILTVEQFNEIVNQLSNFK